LGVNLISYFYNVKLKQNKMKKLIVKIVLSSLLVSSVTVSAKPKHKKESWLREAFINGNKKDVRGNIIVTVICVSFGAFMVTGSIPLNQINDKLSKYNR